MKNHQFQRPGEQIATFSSFHHADYPNSTYLFLE
jgi:hypothetical protein